MNACSVSFSFLTLTCFAAAFVQKVSLIPRRAPLAWTGQPRLVAHSWDHRRVSTSLLSSIYDEMRKHDTGNETDPMSKQDLKWLRGFLALVDETDAEELIKATLRELEDTIPQQPPTRTRGIDLDGAEATTAATISFPSAYESITDSFNLTRVEVNGKAAFRLFASLLESLDDDDDDDDKDGHVTRSLTFARPSLMKYATYGAHNEFPDVNLTGLMKRLDGSPPSEYIFSKMKFIRLATRIFKVNAGLALTDFFVFTAPTAQEKYHAVFTNKPFLGPFDLVPLPKHTYEHWKEDAEFSRQFLDGVNPLEIRVVKNVNQDLSNELINFFKDQTVVDLQSLVNEKRLLFVSYDDLAQLHVNPHQAYPEPDNAGHPQDQPRYFSAPIVVFQLSNNRQELQVLAIQLDRTSGAEIYSPNTTDANTWLFAKTIVKSADAQMHEWVSHLGKSHLTMEPHIIAIHNTLRMNDHPLFTFFQPLVRDTLYLGSEARRTLAKFGKDSFGDRVTSVGVGQFMQLIQMYWKRYNFFESSGLENELASRGFDKGFDIPCYHYRTDGLELWNAYGRFAMNFLEECNMTDSNIANDAVLQEWAKEATDPDKAAIPGFPESFKDKNTLAAVMQTLFWIASGLHAATNFPQYENYAFQANYPLGLRQNMEHFKKANQPDLDWMCDEAFPSIDVVKETINTAITLTLPSNCCIDNLADNFRTVGTRAYEKFKEDLKAIGDGIDTRNDADAKKGGVIYPYLHPSKVPASIDI